MSPLLPPGQNAADRCPGLKYLRFDMYVLYAIPLPDKLCTFIREESGMFSLYLLCVPVSFPIRTEDGAFQTSFIEFPDLCVAVLL